MKNLHILIFFLTFSATYAQDGNFHLDKVYKLKKDGMIDLNSSDAKVFITGSLRPDAHIKIDRKIIVKGANASHGDFRVEVNAENGGLRIREYESGFHSGFITYIKEEYRIEIEAPEGISLTIRGDDGDYYIKNINGDISMSLDDADAELSDCKGKSFSFRLDDGDIRMDRGRGNLEIQADDGDVEINNGQFSAIRAKSDDGDLIIETSLSDSGEYFFDSQDGAIVLNVTGGGGDFDIRHDDASVTAHGDFKTRYESDDQTRLSLSTGSAKVNVRADDARVRLTHVAEKN